MNITIYHTSECLLCKITTKKHAILTNRELFWCYMYLHMVNSHQDYLPAAFALEKYVAVSEDTKLVIVFIANIYEYNIYFNQYNSVQI